MGTLQGDRRGCPQIRKSVPTRSGTVSDLWLGHGLPTLRSSWLPDLINRWFHQLPGVRSAASSLTGAARNSTGTLPITSFAAKPVGEWECSFDLTRLYPRVTAELLLLTVPPGCNHRAVRIVHIDGKRGIGKPITTSGVELL